MNTCAWPQPVPRKPISWTLLFSIIVLSRKNTSYPAVTKWCLERIRTIITPKDLESYLQFLETSKSRRAWVSHRTICSTLKKTGLGNGDGFLDLHMRALGNSQCDAVFLSQDQRLKENKEYQTLLFEQWMQRGSKKNAALGLMDLRFIPQERLIAVLMSTLAAKDVDKCYAILVEMCNAGISLGDGAFLPFFAQVIKYRDSKSAIESLQELAVEGLRQQFSIESLKILVEAQRLSDPDNAKDAKVAIEKIRLYLSEKAALQEMEINQKLIEAGRRTK